MIIQIQLSDVEIFPISSSSSLAIKDTVAERNEESSETFSSTISDVYGKTRRSTFFSSMEIVTVGQKDILVVLFFIVFGVLGAAI